MYQKKINKVNWHSNIIYLFIIIGFSFLINDHFGHKGLMPLDDLQNFNSGYRILSGDFPFKDYYSISGPILDLTQALFYKLFGVSWNSLVIHSSFFYCLYALSIFFFLKNYNFSNNIALIYSLSGALLMSPTSGNPTVEHHSLILSTISLILFIIGSKRKSKPLVFLVPFVLTIAFFIKQVPTAYFIILISAIYFMQLFGKIKIKEIFSIIVVGFLSLFLVLLFFYMNNVKIAAIFEQYIIFALSLGENRISSINFENIFDIIKKLLFSIFCLIPLIIFFFKDKNYDFLILSIGLFILLVFYELHSMNQLITFSLLPIFIFFVHKKILEQDYNMLLIVLLFIIITYAFFRILRFDIYYIFGFFIFLIFIGYTYLKKIFKVEYLIIIYLLISTSFYFEKYVKLRKWDDISFNKKNFFKGEQIDNKFKNLKWQTAYFNESYNEKEFILKMKNLVQEIGMDNFLYITDYQIFNVILNKRDFSPVKYWHYNTSFPSKSHPARKKFEIFFKSKLKDNNIRFLISDNTALNYQEISEFSWILSCTISRNNFVFGGRDIFILEFSPNCF